MQHTLHTISPVDGRYADKTRELIPYFSEYALIRARVHVEVRYLVALLETGLSKLPSVSPADTGRLETLLTGFSAQDAIRIKEIEKTTNHDVKAVEYFLKEYCDRIGIGHAREWVHFGLTSQDINNTAVPLLTHAAMTDVMLPALDEVIDMLHDCASRWRQVPMLARTHGQPASPTTMGKELAVFVERLVIQRDTLRAMPFYGKFGGATGNFNAHRAAYPSYDWPAFAERFLTSLGLIREKTTTQIDHYDHLAALFHAWMRVDTILIDLCRDLWQYIAMEYLIQQPVAGEVGSSAMPHKVNPIDFENAEGNLGIANALFDHLAMKLPVSRLQRDLTDSTVLRNIGVPFAHTLIALQAVKKGLGKVTINTPQLHADLDRHWIILAEAIQTILRREGFAEPYELLKSLTRGTRHIDKSALWEFIDGLAVSDEVKAELKALTPHTYTGFV